MFQSDVTMARWEQSLMALQHATGALKAHISELSYLASEIPMNAENCRTKAG